MQRIAAVLLTLLSTSVFAQSSMTYAPAAAQGAGPQAVPIPALFLIPLGLILAIVGIRAVKKNGSAVLGALLAITGTVAVVSGGVVIQDAVALISETELSDPNGAAITVPEILHQYRNTSGVQLKITKITPPCPVSNTAFNACVVEGEIAIDGTCNTEYICTPPPQVCLAGDTDGDGICDDVDFCPLDNPDDTDGDGKCDSSDVCPLDNPDDPDGDGECGTPQTPLQPELCSETCGFSNDGDCDDGGPLSDYNSCELGTDCTDCGVRCPAGLVPDTNNPGFCTFPST